ncbi:hypothetical protein HGG76_21800 [Ochrobactrum tritici]|uniref:Outer membrane autotransporter n=1 Tax=Brucella tritici TaxID=94626 RepID=A0A7X6FUH0_9HYPH|nr:hypothetical protein [Brucella tritici]
MERGGQLDFEFGAPGANFSTFGQGDSVRVEGDLTVNAAVLNVINIGGMGPGLYNLFSYGGILSFYGGGFAPPVGSSLQILNTPKQINLVNMAPGSNSISGTQTIWRTFPRWVAALVRGPLPIQTGRIVRAVLRDL